MNKQIRFFVLAVATFFVAITVNAQTKVSGTVSPAPTPTPTPTATTPAAAQKPVEEPTVKSVSPASVVSDKEKDVKKMFTLRGANLKSIEKVSTRLGGNEPVDAVVVDNSSDRELKVAVTVDPDFAGKMNFYLSNADSVKADQQPEASITIKNAAQMEQERMKAQAAAAAKKAKELEKAFANNEAEVIQLKAQLRDVQTKLADLPKPPSVDDVTKAVLASGDIRALKTDVAKAQASADDARQVAVNAAVKADGVVNLVAQLSQVQQGTFSKHPLSRDVYNAAVRMGAPDTLPSRGNAPTANLLVQQQ